MKKYIKFFLVALTIIGAYIVYSYVIFDDEPFDNLKAGEISRAYFTSGNEKAEITDIGSLPEMLDDIELEKRVFSPKTDLQKGAVTVELCFDNGNSTVFTIDNSYVHTEKGSFLADRKENIAFLRSAFRALLFGSPLPKECDEAKVNDLVVMAVEGKSYDDIREFAKHSLFAGGMQEDALKSLANQGFSPVYIYALKADTRQKLERDVRYNTRKTIYRMLVSQLWNDYKNSSIVYEHPYVRPPADFVFGDVMDDRAKWDTMEFIQNEMGYFYTVLHSADGRYDMTVTIDDNVYSSIYGNVIDNDPYIRFISFSLHSDSIIPADYPPIDVIGGSNALASADILTKKLTFCMDTSSAPENPVFNKTMFICTLKENNPAFCYYNIFPLLKDLSATQFKTTNMERVIHQVFGDYSWTAKKDFPAPPNGGYNEETQSFEFSTDFGWGVLFFKADNISSSFSDDSKQIYSDFDLSGPDREITTDPVYKPYGRYRAVYDIISENGETFLRFVRYEKLQ